MKCAGLTLSGYLMPTDNHTGKAKQTMGLRIERWGPLVLAFIVFALIVVFQDWVAGKFEFDGWQSSSLYAAIFDWSAIQTGFAFGVYGFVIGKSDGFLEKIKGTSAMDRFVGYIRNANAIGFVLTISSIPLIIVDPKITATNDLCYVIVAVWFSTFIWSFTAFLRLAYNFGIIASTKDVEFHGA